MLETNDPVAAFLWLKRKGLCRPQFSGKPQSYWVLTGQPSEADFDEWLECVILLARHQAFSPSFDEEGRPIRGLHFTGGFTAA